MRDACRRGHPYTEGSWKWQSDGSRRCLVCKRMTQRSWTKREMKVARAVRLKCEATA